MAELNNIPENTKKPPVETKPDMASAPLNAGQGREESIYFIGVL